MLLILRGSVLLMLVLFFSVLRPFGQNIFKCLKYKSVILQKATSRFAVKSIFSARSAGLRGVQVTVVPRENEPVGLIGPGGFRQILSVV
jgi:hypothetical protein